MFDNYQIDYIAQARAPQADCYAGGVTTDVFNAGLFHAVAFVMHQGAIEDAGISNLVTLLACDDTTPSNTSTMAFRHRTWTATTDAWTAWTESAAAGYNFNVNNAVANGIHIVLAESAEVAADGGNGYQYVQLSVAETANKTVTAGIVFLGLNARHRDSTPVGATT